jgi:hypothetical protein
MGIRYWWRGLIHHQIHMRYKQSNLKWKYPVCQPHRAIVCNQKISET